MERTIADLLDTSPETVAVEPGVRASGLPSTVKAADLARLLGLSTNRIAQLAKEGAIPKVTRGVYPLPDAVTAYVAYAARNPTGRPRIASDQKDRLTAAQADLAEIKLAQARGDLLPAAEVRTRWVGYTSALRAALLAVPPRLTARMGLDRKAAAEFDAELRAALDQIATDGQERPRKGGSTGESPPSGDYTPMIW